MQRKLLSVLILGLVLPNLAAAIAIEGVEYPATMDVAGAKLEVNGLGLRKVERFGLPFKVYVAGLYAAKKSTSADEHLNATTPRVIKMTFLRRVGKSDMAEAFESGHSNNCTLEKPRCEAAKKVLKSMTDKMPDMLDKSTMTFTFFDNRVEYNLAGRTTQTGSLDGADIAKTLLAVFIGAKPPTEQLKNGLLGFGK